MSYQLNRESKLALAFLILGAILGLGLTRMNNLLANTFGWIGLLLCLVLIGIVVYFFRDPERSSEATAEMIVAPADGRVIRVENTREEKHLQGPAQRVAIFMHVGNVHVQRMPSDGKLLWVRHQPGKFYPILDSRAPMENEQRWYAFETRGLKYTLVQIAGILAKRTMSWLEPNHDYRRGERLGMIALGSEVDVYLPPTAEVLVKVGDRVYAGETVIGRWGTWPGIQK